MRAPVFGLASFPSLRLELEVGRLWRLIWLRDLFDMLNIIYVKDNYYYYPM